MRMNMIHTSQNMVAHPTPSQNWYSSLHVYMYIASHLALPEHVCWICRNTQTTILMSSQTLYMELWTDLHNSSLIPCAKQMLWSGKSWQSTMSSLVSKVKCNLCSTSANLLALQCFEPFCSLCFLLTGTVTSDIFASEMCLHVT